jgi:hypothetical protein
MNHMTRHDHQQMIEQHTVRFKLASIPLAMIRSFLCSQTQLERHS